MESADCGIKGTRRRNAGAPRLPIFRDSPFAHKLHSAGLPACNTSAMLRWLGLIMQLNNDEIRRYSRHLILPEVGLAGQKKIKATSVLCIGAGGLGSPIAMYLAAAGIGKLGLVDFDTVDFSNLQRQIIHGTEDIGRPKTQSAKETIAQ